MASLAPIPRTPIPEKPPVPLRQKMDSCVAHDHICLIYETVEEQLEAVVPFLRTGLERGEKCVYIVAENPPEVILEALRADGVAVDAAVGSGALTIVSPKDAYLKNGDFEASWMIEFLRRAVENAEAEGYTSFRVSGETTWATRYPEPLDSLIEYECRLNNFFPRHNVLALCQYNRRCFQPETLLNVLRTHSLVARGELLCDNPHYIPPESFNELRLDPAAEVQRLLDSITENAQLKCELAAEAEQANLLSAETARWRQNYEAVLASTPDLGYIFDLNHRFTFANGALLSMWGRTWEEAIGKTCLELGYEPWHAAMHDREIDQVIATGKRIRGEVPFTGANGRRIYDYIFFPILGPTGEVEAVGGSSRDVTERKRTEEALRESEQRFRTMVETTPECVKLLTADGTLLQMNPPGLEIIGAASEEEVVGQSVYGLIAPEFREEYRSFNERVCGGWKGSLQFDIVGLQGERRHLETHATPLKMPDGQIVHLALTRDVTERKQSEEELRRSEKRYRELLDALPVPVYTTDAQGTISLYNQAAAKFAGRQAEIGKDKWCVTHRLYRDDGTVLPHEECPMAVSLLTGQPQHGIEAIAERPDGTRAWFVPYPTLLRDTTGNINGGINVLVDISQRKRAETLLLEQKRLLELIATGCPLEQCLTALTASVKRLWPTASAAVLIADEARENINRALSSEFPESMGAGVYGAPIGKFAIGTCGKAIFEGKPVTCADIANDETWSKPWRDLCIAHGVFAAHSTPVFSSTEKAVASFFMCFSEPHEPDDWERNLGEFGAHIAGIAIDRDRATRAMHESEQRLEAELADMRQLQIISSEIAHEEKVEGLYGKILDAAVAIMHADLGSMQMLYPERGSKGELHLIASRGLSQEAERFWEWVRPGNGCTCGAALLSSERVIVSDIEKCEWLEQATIAMYRKGGIRAVQATPLVSRGGKLLGMISTHWRNPHQPSERELRTLDILARQAADLLDRKLAAERQKQSEAALRKSEKFAAAGRMAATIAHEINNPLEAIVNLCYLLEQENLSPAARKLVGALDSELDRVSHIAKQTLEFYRRGKSAKPIDIADPINAATLLFSRKAEAGGVRIETEFRASSKIFGFPGELRQVFANLINNALEAGSTRIRIRVSPAHDPARGNRAGLRVVLADNGSGIPAETVKKLFEPFFTTKEEKGTGLGLWVSKGIIQKHEGWIRMHTSTRADRRGTTFCLFLPVLNEEQSRGDVG